VRGLVRFFVLRPAALVGFLLVIVLIVAGIVLLPTYMSYVPGLSALRPPSEPVSTVEYLRGNRDYNAQVMWSSLSGDAQERLRGQGGSLEDLQRQMETAKRTGVKLEEISYVGGKVLPDGTSVQFYLVGVRPQPQSDVDYQPYMFTLDRDGKIAKVQ
jgi:hypothetical protein